MFAATPPPRLLKRLVKLAWPRTPSAAAPSLRPAALAKRSTRLFDMSATQRVPSLPRPIPIGELIVFAATLPPRLTAPLVKSA